MLFETLSDARLLLAIADAPSFAHAGRSLGMPPATVTRRMAALEENAGVRLFERSSRAVRPTEAGLALLDHARRLVSEADSAEMAMETLRDTPKGWIRVTAPAILGEAMLGPVIASFLKENPQSDVFLDLSADPADLVAEGYDVAIRTGPLGDADLIARKVGVASAALYRRTQPGKAALRSLDDLEGQAFGLLRRSGPSKNSITLIDRDGASHQVTVNPRLVSLDARVLLDAALEMDITVVLPRMVAYPAVISGQLQCEFPDHSLHLTDVTLLFTSRRLMRPVVRALIDHLATELPPKLTQFEYP